jgi:hypothetical protein
MNMVSQSELERRLELDAALLLNMSNKHQPAQVPYITSPADIAVFGGARDGGKTFGSLGNWWLYAEAYGVYARISISGPISDSNRAR